MNHPASELEHTGKSISQIYYTFNDLNENGLRYTLKTGLAKLGCLIRYLTHCARVTHICVSKITSACSAPSHYLNQCWNIINWCIGNKLLIGIQAFSFKEMYLKMFPEKWRPFCLCLNVLTQARWRFC